jgi:mannose-6-phosphate isomerase
MVPVRFAPIAMERLWGGNQLKAWFGETRPEPIGEYWVLSGHPNGTSVVADGPYRGMTLTELIERFPEAYLGSSPQGRFPLLIKFIEAQADLSVQIHPDDAYAREHAGDFGKTEAWYVLDCPTEGRVVYGHRWRDRADYMASVQLGRVRDALETLPIRKHQLVYVPSRTLHALLAGTTVIEVQQTSDVTYRVYDWDRVDASGKPRALHIEQAADVIDFASTQTQDMLQQQASPEPVKLFHEGGAVCERLVSCPYFRIDRIVMEADASVRVPLGEAGQPDVFICAEGSGILRWDGGEMPFSRGTTVLIPATLRQYELVSTAGFVGLRTFYPPTPVC